MPLGLRVLKNIEAIVRQEMNELGGQEILMAALQPKQNWEATKRWQTFNALFKVKSQYEAWYALGPTHEEIVTPLAKNIFSLIKICHWLYIKFKPSLEMSLVLNLVYYVPESLL